MTKEGREEGGCKQRDNQIKKKKKRWKIKKRAENGNEQEQRR